MKLLFTLVSISSIFYFTNAQQIAFPSAEGAGRFTSGGRGSTSALTSIYYVTSLADDGSVGTLRYAINQTATNRTILFKVSGTIRLLSNLSIKANTTIAGQTAPGDGICLSDYTVTFGGNNIIVRHIRFRLGDKNQLKTTPANCGVPYTPFTAACMPLNGSGGDDAFGGTGRKNILIDHCTMTWSNDEACSIYSGDSTTIQWCMLSEPLNFSYHFETGDVDFERHGYGGIWGGRRASFHHNLLAHCQGRNPRFDGSRNLDGGATVGVENCEFVNNVIYNWGAYTVNGGEGGNYNIINNYYKYGPNTGSTVKSQVINPYVTAPLPYGKYFLSGNYIDGYTSVTNNNWLGAKMQSGTTADTTQSKVTIPFSISNLSYQSSLDAYNSVLNNVGVTIPGRDTLDARIVKNVINRTGAIIDVQGNYPHGTAFSSTLNAWPTLISGTAPNDTDNDGMPNWWEKREGLDTASAIDRNGIATNNYTNLENYLNAIPVWNNHANFSSFVGNKLSSSLARFTFIADWVKDGFTYTLFRSSDSLGTYSNVNSLSSEMNTVNFSIDDASLPLTTVYYKIGSYKVGVTPDTLYSNIIKIEGIITPVKLSKYDVYLLKNNTIENRWVTSTEINTLNFNIQRSYDGNNFEKIGTVQAKGSGEYMFIDKSINNTSSNFKLYYRLEIVDKDGSKTYSEVKFINLKQQQSSIEVYPNPVTNSFVVKHPFAESNSKITVIDSNGITCYQSKVIEGSTSTTINQLNIIKGKYIVIFNNDKTQSSINIVVL